jgi:hypothetical protein
MGLVKLPFVLFVCFVGEIARFLGSVFCFCLLCISASAAGVHPLSIAPTDYPTNTLGYALERTYSALTNRPGYAAGNDMPWNGFIYGSTNAAWSWNPNSILYRKRGASGISVAQLGTTQARFCLLTRRHAVTAGHYGGISPGGVIWFLGTNNLVHGLTIARVATPIEGEDRTLVFFNRDVPANVEPMAIAGPVTKGVYPNIFGVVGEYLPPDHGSPYRSPPVFFVCQHGHCGRHIQSHPNGHIGVDGGDSGGPGFIILSNQCLNVGGISMSSPGTNLFRRMDEMTVSMGLKPSDYQPRFVSLAAYPRWPQK